MNQNIWGSHLWFSLHTISFAYPIKPTITDQNNYKNFFVSLQFAIPCSVCQRNYKRHLLEHPIDKHLNSRKDLVYWLIDIHNMVNSEIGKKFMSYDVVIKKYENVYQKDLFVGKNMDYDDNHISENGINNKNKYNYNLEYILLLILIIIFIIFIIRIPKNSLIYL